MSSALDRLGRFSARRPWTVIGLWVVLAATVIVSSAALGRQLEDTFAVPGLDSQEAVDLLAARRRNDPAPPTRHRPVQYPPTARSHS